MAGDCRDEWGDGSKRVLQRKFQLVTFHISRASLLGWGEANKTEERTRSARDNENRKLFSCNEVLSPSVGLISQVKARL